MASLDKERLSKDTRDQQPPGVTSNPTMQHTDSSFTRLLERESPEAELETAKGKIEAEGKAKGEAVAKAKSLDEQLAAMVETPAGHRSRITEESSAKDRALQLSNSPTIAKSLEAELVDSNRNSQTRRIS